MLEIKKKKYEIEESVQLKDESDNLIYEFTMQITAEELQEIRKMLFEDAEKMGKKYAKANVEDKSKLENEIEDKIKSKSEKFENICFKEHKIPFKEKAGQYKYDELVENMMSFFINFFVEKQLKQVNIGFMNLKKFMNK